MNLVIPDMQGKRFLLAGLCGLLAAQGMFAECARADIAPFWAYEIADQAAEQATYDNVLNWNWTASDKVPEFSNSYSGPGSSGFDVHDSAEGDDLWTHYQQYLRTGNTLHRDWARGWRDYYASGAYRSDLQSSCGTGFLYDHTFGQGLVLWAYYENDAAALAEAEAIAGVIESYHSGLVPGSDPMAFWGSRSSARHLIVASYVAQMTGAQRWITLRDQLIDGWVQSPDWETGIVGGNYFIGRDAMTSASSSASAYDAGRRANSAFQIGLHVEALWRAYMATGRDDVRSRLVDIAKWVEYYAHDPAYVNPMVGAWLGQNGDGSRWHRDGDSGNANINGADPSYDTSLVNSLVIGYKLTGEGSMLAMARTLFRKGTQWPAGVYGRSKLVADDEVHHFVDTLNNPDVFLFDYNKGELQYVYLLFENNGNPAVLGARPRAPSNLITD